MKRTAPKCGMTPGQTTHRSKPTSRSLARRTLFAFILTFFAARILTFLIMAGSLPDLYLHLSGTHVHHLNYGIFLLAGLGAYLLFAPTPKPNLRAIAALYGIGLALTFDEFGMWLHLGGPYWQRASFDAVIVLAALLALLGFAPPLSTWHPRQVRAAVVLLAATLLFYFLLAQSFRFTTRIAPHFEHLEQHAPR